MKRLSYKQIQKKASLLQKYKTSAKGKTRNLLSKHWQDYRKKKFIIEELPKYRKRIAKASPDKKEFIREKYFDRKAIAVKQLEYGNLIVVKKKKGVVSKHDDFTRDTNLYKVKASDKLDNTIEKLFQNSKTKYVLVTLKVRLKETEQIIYISESFNAEGWEVTKELEQTAMERTLDKFSNVTRYEGFELLGIYLKVIYATPTKTVIKEKHRKNKK